MIAWIRKLFFSIIPVYRRLELKCFNFIDADELLRECQNEPEEWQWHIAKEEDYNTTIGTVWLERKKRIIE